MPGFRSTISVFPSGWDACWRPNRGRGRAFPMRVHRITASVWLRIEERFRWSAHRSSRSSCKAGAPPTELRPVFSKHQPSSSRPLPQLITQLNLRARRRRDEKRRHGQVLALLQMQRRESRDLPSLGAPQVSHPDGARSMPRRFELPWSEDVGRAARDSSLFDMTEEEDRSRISTSQESRATRLDSRRSASSRGRLRATRWPPSISSAQIDRRSRATCR
jgi:hypothetical protein